MLSEEAKWKCASRFMDHIKSEGRIPVPTMRQLYIDLEEIFAIASDNEIMEIPFSVLYSKPEAPTSDDLEWARRVVLRKNLTKHVNDTFNADPTLGGFLKDGHAYRDYQYFPEFKEIK